MWMENALAWWKIEKKNGILMAAWVNHLIRSILHSKSTPLLEWIFWVGNTSSHWCTLCCDMLSICLFLYFIWCLRKTFAFFCFYKILVYRYPFKMPSYNLALMLRWFQKFVFGQLYFSFSYLSLPERVVREENFFFSMYLSKSQKSIFCRILLVSFGVLTV